MRVNPYTPGAGFMPVYLAGREKLISNAEGYLKGLQKRYPQQSVVYYGLRGVGKTVLINTIEEYAENIGIRAYHLEASEQGDFTSRLIRIINKFLREISMVEAAKDFIAKCSALLKSFTVTYSAEDNSLEFGIDPEQRLTSGIYADDLTELFVSMGKAAVKSENSVCFFVDEVQYLNVEEIGGFITAVHRCNQLRLPVMVFCAGLPKILKTIGDACSYSERLFKFELVGALNCEESEAAITVPAEDAKVSYSAEAIKEIISETGGYPYYIQEFCSSIWDSVDDKEVIELSDVIQAESIFKHNLDTGFFAVRYNRCTRTEKDFMVAMVKCGKLPCNISNVAKNMRKSVKSASPYRAQLINKGMIYPTGRAEIDFTVPQFDEFIKRINPNLELSNF